MKSNINRLRGCVPATREEVGIAEWTINYDAHCVPLRINSV